MEPPLRRSKEIDRAVKDEGDKAIAFLSASPSFKAPVKVIDDETIALTARSKEIEAETISFTAEVPSGREGRAVVVGEVATM
jgi:hypothetical protein